MLGMAFIEKGEDVVVIATTGLLNSGCHHSLLHEHHSRGFIILFHGILIGIINNIVYSGKNCFVITSQTGDNQCFQCILADSSQVKILLKSYSCQGNLPIKH